MSRYSTAHLIDRLRQHRQNGHSCDFPKDWNHNLPGPHLQLHSPHCPTRSGLLLVIQCHTLIIRYYTYVCDLVLDPFWLAQRNTELPLWSLAFDKQHWLQLCQMNHHILSPTHCCETLLLFPRSQAQVEGKPASLGCWTASLYIRWCMKLIYIIVWKLYYCIVMR